MLSNLLENIPAKIPKSPDKIIQKFISKFSKISAETPAVTTVRRVDFDLINGTIMAIKVSGIMNCKSKNSGKSLPIKTPNNVEICQEINKVMPEPKR